MCDYSRFKLCLFNNSKSKRDFYRDAGCMKKFSADLEKNVTEIMNDEKKQMLSSTDTAVKS